MHDNPAIVLFLKSLAPGERWITVRPNGPGTEGHPLLIKPTGDGAMKVIGGAGGKLNHLRLTGVRSESAYKEEAKGRVAAQKAEKARRTERDKAHGIHQNKTQAKALIREQLQTHQAKFVEAVAEAAGWTPEQMRFPEEKFQNATPAARKVAEQRHVRALVAKAHEAVDQQRKRLLDDADARSEAGLGEVKMVDPAPDTLTVQDLDPITESTKGLGFAPKYGERAEDAGLTPAETKAEAAAAKPPAKVPEGGGPTPEEKRKATAERVAEELKGIRDPGPAVDARAVVDAKKAVELLKAEKALKAVARDAREKTKKIDQATVAVEPKAYVLEVVSRPVDDEIVKDLENDLRTIRTRAFLDEAGAGQGGVEALGRHIGVGAYNSVNALALAAGGASLVDRSVVDVLGVAGAAQVLVRRLNSSMTPAEMEDIKAAMGQFHVDHYMALSDKALREAREWHEMAHEIEIGDAANGADLSVAQEMNAKRREFIGNAQEVLGTALGEMEANAAIVTALEQPAKDQVQASLGKTPIEAAIRQARAIGLDRGDYQIERIGASTMLTVTGAGMDKLAKPIAKADMERTRGALDIIEGRKDEDGWLPAGVADRPDMAMNITPGTAKRLAEPFPDRPADVGQAVKDYIGGRAADGDTPAEIMEGLLSEDMIQRSGDRSAFMKAVNEVAPLYDADGKMIRAEQHQSGFDALADKFVADRHGADRAPLHRQKFEVDDKSVDALHRALAQNPEGVAAFKPIGDLTPQDQGALRATFASEYGRADPAAEGLRAELAKMDAAEPAREVEDMFGTGPNPEHAAWKRDRDAHAERVNKATMTWAKYLDVMGSPANAYAAMQDVIKSHVFKGFADAHNRLHADKPLKLGRTVISNDLNHLDALDPAARERRLDEHRDMVDRMRNRVAGRYSSGSVSDKLDAARAADEAATQAQMGLFGDAAPAKAGAEPDKEPSLGERYTIGHQAERQIAGMMPIVGKNFRPGQPVHLWKPDMSGAYVGRQRAVKLIEHNGHTELGMGVGSGKTSIMLAGYTNLQAKGKAGRGMFLVPSIVQGQFHGEALTLLQPGKFNWHCNPGAGRAERIAAYKNPDVHFNVVTHQAFRDDMLHLAGKRDGTTPAEAATKLAGMKPAERAAYMTEMLKAEGIDHNYLAVDEGHNLLNRAGKEDSHMANVVDAVSRGMPTYVNATADPVKNDASEAFDVLAKMDPERYSNRDEFMRRYGVNTAASRDGLKREMARHFYTGKIDPGVKANKTEVKVPLAPDQHAKLTAIDDAAAAGRLARMKGEVDQAAMKVLSPGSFEGVDPAQHESIAKNLQQSLGILANTARGKAMSGSAKTDALAEHAKARKGKPGVVFAHGLSDVAAIEARLKKDGHRVVTLTGGDSSADKDRKKREYQAGQHDIIVCSDAGAVGANLQRGKWLVQYDTPQTAMLHAQRQGRINRIGQTEDVELTDLVADHPVERKARARLADKYELRDIMTSPMEGLDDSGLAGYLQRAKAGTLEAGQPMHMPAEPHEIPEHEPEEQGGLF